MSFFTYKSFIEGYSGGDMFSPAHLLLTASAVAVLVVLCVLFRNASHRAVTVYLRVVSLILPVMEITKITWETYYDLRVTGSFNYPGLLPLYACSLFLYVLPVAAFARGKVQEYALSFLTTLGIFAGLTNFVYLNILNTYPLLHYASANSFVFHFLMVFTGIFIVATGYYRPSWKSILRAEAVFALYSIPVIAVNVIGNRLLGGFDYAFLYDGHSCPILLSSIAGALGDGLRPLYTVIAVTGYLVPTAVVWAVEAAVFRIFRKR